MAVMMWNKGFIKKWNFVCKENLSKENGKKEFYLLKIISWTHSHQFHELPLFWWSWEERKDFGKCWVKNSVIFQFSFTIFVWHEMCFFEILFYVLRKSYFHDKEIALTRSDWNHWYWILVTEDESLIGRLFIFKVMNFQIFNNWLKNYFNERK